MSNKFVNYRALLLYKVVFLSLISALAVINCTRQKLSLKGKELDKRHKLDFVGMVSYYSSALIGKKTASGQQYSPFRLTAAHRSLPFGSKVKVTNLKNLRTVVVVINDRGPFVRGRVLDLSKRAASEIGILSSGIARVRAEVINLGQSKNIDLQNRTL
jgi:rare lipoprotein A